MRFRKFFENTTGGAYGYEDTRPSGSGRQQELPGLQMSLSQKELEGVVAGRKPNDNAIRIDVIIDGIKKEIEVPIEKYDRHPLNNGDRIKMVINRDGSLQDYQKI